MKIPQNMRLVWLPAYSPQCNPVEHLWDEICEKWFANKVFDSMAAVEDIRMDTLVTLENDEKKVAGIAGFDWIVSIHLNASYSIMQSRCRQFNANLSNFLLPLCFSP